MTKSCAKCLRLFVIIFNIIFLLIGLALLGFALYAYIDPNIRILRNANTESAAITELVLYLFMGIGVITVLVGTFGCCGAYHESECLLGTYFTCVLIIFVAETTVVCVSLFVYRTLFIEKVSDYVDSLAAGYHNNPKHAEVMNRIQQSLECCGSSKGADIYFADAQKMNAVALPSSCCSSGASKCSGITDSDKLKTALSTRVVYQQNCSKAIIKFISDNRVFFIIAFGCVALIQLLAMLLACGLCCCVKRQLIDDGYLEVHT